MLVASATALVSALSSAAVALVLAVGLVTNWRDYRSRSRAQAAEANAKLAETFAGLVTTANGRGPNSLMSETAAAKLLEGFDEWRNEEAVQNRLLRAVVPGRVGLATQIAAVAAIAELVAQHQSFLLAPGNAALQELRRIFAEPAELRAALDAALDRVKNAS